MTTYSISDNCELLRATLRRMVETGGECQASISLRNKLTGEWFLWDSCNSEPGHDGKHQVWSDRDSDYWAEWTDDGVAKSPYVDLTGGEQRLEPSPWTEQELATLARVGAGQENSDERGD